MPKIKTAKGVKRRFKKTGTGKIMSYSAGGRHLLGGKRTKAKRKLRKPLLIPEQDAKSIRLLLPA